VVWCKAFYRVQNGGNPFKSPVVRPTITAPLNDDQLAHIADLAREAAPPGTVLEKVLEVTDDGNYLRTLFPE